MQDELPHAAEGDLFVFYGLLKQGAAGMPKHIDLEATGIFAGPCRFRGEMFDLGGFPGIVDGKTLCHGVKWRIEDTGVLAALDAFEDVLPDDPARSLYWRGRIALCDESGAETGEIAHIYLYNQPISGYSRIETGNWPLEKGIDRS